MLRVRADAVPVPCRDQPGVADAVVEQPDTEDERREDPREPGGDPHASATRAPKQRGGGRFASTIAEALVDRGHAKRPLSLSPLPPAYLNLTPEATAAFCRALAAACGVSEPVATPCAAERIPPLPICIAELSSNSRGSVTLPTPAARFLTAFSCKLGSTIPAAA